VQVASPTIIVFCKTKYCCVASAGACVHTQGKGWPFPTSPLHEEMGLTDSPHVSVCGDCRGRTHAQGAGFTPQAYSAEQVASPIIVIPCGRIQMWVEGVC
jgi:hypothetical protein